MLSLLTVLYLATTAPVSRSLGALHAKHTAGVQPKLIYGLILALVLMLPMFLLTLVSALINFSSAMVTRTSHGF